LLIFFSNYIAGKYKIITFDEFILIALYAERVVGIYPEIKSPIFINQYVGDFNLTNS
jgi:hypothetical protein